MTQQHSAKSVLSMRATNSRKEDKLLFEILGKQVSVFYNDTANTVSFKEGKLTDFDSFSLMVIENSNSRPTLIPRGKCIRIEQNSTAPASPETKELPFAKQKPFALRCKSLGKKEFCSAKQKPNQQIITGGAKIATPAR
ncbi:MAG: hypothetical protein Q8N60_04785 [Candidatus Diapherotrites archaeon]|nr:hypothetical protein [Candidatus Diapherotrites archaeon]